MSLFGDAIVESTNTVGTGSYVLEGPPAGKRPFSALGTGGKVYWVTSEDGTVWESVYGVLSTGPDVLTRDTILASSNEGNPVDWPDDAPKYVYSTPPATVMEGLATTNRSATAPVWAEPGTRWIDTSSYDDAGIWLPKVYDGSIWMPEGYIDPDVALAGAFVYPEQFAHLVDGTDWAPALLAAFEASSEKSAVCMLRGPATTYRVESRIWLRDKPGIFILGRKAKILVPDIEGPEGFHRVLKVVDSDHFTLRDVRMVSERGLDKTGRTFGLCIENTSHVDVFGCGFEGFTGRGITVSQDTERREIFDLGPSPTDRVTIAGYDPAELAEHMLVGIRETETAFESSAIDTGADTLAWSDHGAVNGQLIGARHSTFDSEKMPAPLRHGHYYAVRVVDADTLQIFPTRADALLVEKSFGPSDVATTTDIITIAGHGFANGVSCRVSSDGSAPGGADTSRRYYIRVLDPDRIQLCLDRGLSWPLDLTSGGSGTHTIARAPIDLTSQGDTSGDARILLTLRRRSLTKDTDWTIDGQDLVFTGGGFASKRVIVDIAKPCNHRRVLHCFFKRCGVNGISEFPKRVSYFSELGHCDFEDCGTEHTAFAAAKPAQATHHAYVHHIRTRGGNVGVTFGNWYTLRAHDLQLIDFHRRGLNLGIGDHGGFDDADGATDIDQDVFSPEGYHFLTVDGVQLAHTNSFTAAGSDGALYIGGTKADPGPVVVRNVATQRVERDLVVKARQPIANIVIDGFRGHRPKARHADTSADFGWLAHGLELRNFEFIGDLADPKAISLQLTRGLLERGLFRAVGTGNNLLSLSDHNTGTRWRDLTFDDCLPGASGTAAAIRGQENVAPGYFYAEGIRITGAASGITHFARETGSAGALWVLGVNHFALPALVDPEHLAPFRSNHGVGFSLPGGLRIGYGSVPPTSGTYSGPWLWLKPDSGLGDPWAWRLVADGSPGTWAPLYDGAAPLDDGDGDTGESQHVYMLGAGATLTLPPGPEVGDRLTIVPKGDWSASNATIARNGSLILGAAADLTLDATMGVSLIYTGSAFGWSVF